MWSNYVGAQHAWVHRSVHAGDWGLGHLGEWYVWAWECAYRLVHGASGCTA